MPDAANLDEAIDKTRLFYLKQFNDAYRVVSQTQPDSPTDDQKKKYAAMQAQMTSSLQQLNHANVMASDKRGRDGYEAVVKLMEDTQSAAKDAYAKLKGLTDAVPSSPPTTPPTAALLIADQQVRIDHLTRILAQLAAIAPIAIWQGAASSSSA